MNASTKRCTAIISIIELKCLIVHLQDMKVVFKIRFADISNANQLAPN